MWIQYHIIYIFRGNRTTYTKSRHCPYKKITTKTTIHRGV